MAAARRVPPALRHEPFCGEWDLHDLLAHLAGWDRTNLEAIDDFLAGRRPGFYDRHDPGWRTFNAELVARYRLDDFEALLASLAASQREVVEALKALPPAELTQARGSGRSGRALSIAGLLRAALRDEREHLRQVQALLQRVR